MTRIPSMITNSTVLVLHNQATFPSSVVPANITTLIVVGNYSPAEMNYNDFTNVETLRMFDGEMTADIRSAIKGLANNNLKYLEVKRWEARFESNSTSGTFNNSKLIEVIGLEDLTSFGNFGFKSSRSMESIYFPYLLGLSYGSFDNCTALTKAYIPKCNYIGYYCFDRTPNLSEVTLTDQITPDDPSTTHAKGVFGGSPIETLSVMQSTGDNLFASLCDWFSTRGATGIIKTSVFILNQDLPNLVARANSVLAQNLSEYPLLANATARILDVGIGITSLSSISGSGNLINKIRMNEVDHART
jgi:hypothetical protein